MSESSGGNDRLQISLAVFAVVMSLVITMMIPMVAPAYDTGTGYSYADIYAEKASLQSYTGQSMTNLTPFVLTDVYTPYVYGGPVNVDDAGWLYGERIDYSRSGQMGQTVIGSTSNIYLDPEYKSSTPLMPAEDTLTYTEHGRAWWAFGADGLPNIFGYTALALGLTDWVFTSEQKTGDFNNWNFTGYRYVFDPMLYLDYTDPDSTPYSDPSQQDGTLSVVWYKTRTSQGLSSGLVLYNDKTRGLVANYDITDIVKNYGIGSTYSTRYTLDFNGASIYLNIRFDPQVMAESMDLTTAFDQGLWTLAITAPSMDNFMDIRNSSSLSNSAGSVLQTYFQILSFDLPNVPFNWSIILWVLCVLPIDMAVLMFLSRYGVLGLAAGLLGNVLLGALAL